MKLNFTPLERKINLLIVCILIFLMGVTYCSNLYPHPFLKILKTALEASLVGALADSYAVFGLFHRIGPHTDLLRRKRKELTERVVHFVSTFLFDREILRRELEKFDLSQIFINIDREKLVPFLEENLRQLLEEFLDVILKNRNWKEQFSYSTFTEFFLLVETIVEAIRRTIKNALLNYLNEKIPIVVEMIVYKFDNDHELQNRVKDFIFEELVRFLEKNHGMIEDIARRRLSEISDEEYLLLLKQASWDELQWIRLNGTILGFMIGLAMGLVNEIIR